MGGLGLGRSLASRGPRVSRRGRQERKLPLEGLQGEEEASRGRSITPGRSPFLPPGSNDRCRAPGCGGGGGAGYHGYIDLSCHILPWLQPRFGSRSPRRGAAGISPYLAARGWGGCE